MSLGIDDLNRLRWEQLARISALRQRPVFVFASDLRNGKAPIAIDYGDIVPFSDRLAGLSGRSVDLVLETPGGIGEVAEDLVRLVRDRFQEFGIIVPGWAKSAGTIMAMAADEMLMGPTSALGPIDAQLSWQGKSFSADALLKGFKDIKDDIDQSGVLSKAYIPILQNISPGELTEAQNQLDFARDLVTQWLATYKFKNWKIHASSGKKVTLTDRRTRAKDVADALCDHGRWFTHGKSLRIEDLRGLRLLITDYSQNPELYDAVSRYFTLLQMLFDSTSIYKVWEVPGSYIVRHTGAATPGPPPPRPDAALTVDIGFDCPKCGNKLAVQADLDERRPLKQGLVPYPEGDKVRCPRCGTETDLTDARRQVELQSKRKVIPYRKDEK